MRRRPPRPVPVVTAGTPLTRLFRRTLGVAFVGAAVALVGLAYTPSPAAAFEPFAAQVPCRATAENSVGTVRPCITCHNNPDGGSGCEMSPCLNPFGMAFNANGRRWTEALALMDSDGDGFTNGEELGDPMGIWRPGAPNVTTCDCATRPGFSMFTPGDTDADGDGFCCRGVDSDNNGDCRGTGENDGVSFDCDEGDADTYFGAMEMCTNTVDNDCDGQPTLSDSDCAAVVDRDGDGYCPMGQDQNGDRDCIDLGEQTADVDCDDDEITVSPVAREFCADLLDNDCDGETDLADDECTSDADADMDGFCPVGRDIDGNGDCNGAGEQDGSFDCDDTRDDVNPNATEVCTDQVDNDCDGLADFRDGDDCGALFDADGDGYCPGGRDGNNDGNCTGEGETDEPGDCDDTNPTISPGSPEICTNGDVDDDCDMVASLLDDDCAPFLDADGDLYCFVGVDADGDGACVTEAEQTGNGDCDEASADVNPGATEICTDGIDNDCDGSADAADRVQCAAYRDVDRDGFCLVGADDNGDFDCADEGEQREPTEWDGETDPHSSTGTEGNPIRYPGAPENCLNRIDDDLDSQIDEEGACRRDVDADMDGWCPIGRDLNGDGDCLDADENIAGTDCNEMDAEIHPDAEERCTELVDADCDGRVGTADADCFRLLDRDRDGVCGTGVDDNGDGDCLDLDEDRFGTDCDDRNPAVHSRLREVCDDGLDNDCDGDTDLADSQCDCESDAQCDDGDPCTADTCGGSGDCEYAPDPMCQDGGVVPTIDAGGTTTTPVDGGCSCRATGRSAGGSPAAGLVLVAFALVLSRRRRGASPCR